MSARLPARSNDFASGPLSSDSCYSQANMQADHDICSSHISVRDLPDSSAIARSRPVEAADSRTLLATSSRHIAKSSMSRARAKKVVEGLKFSSPFLTRAEFVECLAALSSMYREEVARVVRSTNRPLWRMLWCAAAPARMNWLFNNCRMRHSLDHRLLSLLPSGTTSNEALHAEINSWFRQTQSVHKSTLRLKLLVMRTAKVLCHDAAMRFPTARQMSYGVVLARCSARPVWTPASWRAWCSELNGCARKRKATVPLHEQRQKDVAAVHAWVQKRPAAMKRPATDTLGRQLKRTPFNRKRMGNFRKGGTKNTMYRST